MANLVLIISSILCFFVNVYYNNVISTIYKSCKSLASLFTDKKNNELLRIKRRISNPNIKIPYLHSKFLVWERRVKAWGHLSIISLFPPSHSTRWIPTKKINAYVHTHTYTNTQLATREIYECPFDQFSTYSKGKTLTLAGYRRRTDKLYGQDSANQKELAGTAAFCRNRSTFDAKWSLWRSATAGSRSRSRVAPSPSAVIATPAICRSRHSHNSDRFQNSTFRLECFETRDNVTAQCHSESLGNQGCDREIRHTTLRSNRLTRNRHRCDHRRSYTIG